jgi:hypothetical protein
MAVPAARRSLFAPGRVGIVELDLENPPRTGS